MRWRATSRMFDLVRDGAVNPLPRRDPRRPARARRPPEGRRLLLRRVDDGRRARCRARRCWPSRSATRGRGARRRAGAQPAQELRRRHGHDPGRRARVGAQAARADRRITRHALVILVEYPRDPTPGEPGCDWIDGTQAQRAAVLAAQTAVLLSTYLRMLGYEARAHTATCSDVDLGKLAVACGLAPRRRQQSLCRHALTAWPR